MRAFQKQDPARRLPANPSLTWQFVAHVTGESWVVWITPPITLGLMLYWAPRAEQLIERVMLLECLFTFFWTIAAALKFKPLPGYPQMTCPAKGCGHTADRDSFELDGNTWDNFICRECGHSFPDPDKEVRS